VNAAILFEPDGYMTNGPKLMGRQAAGDGFLRAAVKHHGGEPLIAYTSKARSAEIFRDRVAELDPQAQIRWLHGRAPERLEAFGVLYRADHALGVTARTRLRVGLDRFAICGVTHTLASAGAMDIITDYAVAPLAPWDALVCTSEAAIGVVETALEAQEDYLRWRLGASGRVRPLLHKIPLGVHGEDFEVADGERAAARAAIGLAGDEVALLFAGRLSFNGKAHPFAMYAAAQAVAQTTSRKLALVHAGQFFTASIERAFREAVAALCPDVRCLFLDGKDPTLYARSWRAADVFVSLSDSIQETFGITPVEAMAAGLPVLVTDWNGYKDTVRDGVDGFRIATWQPAPGTGEGVARDFEVGALDYDAFLARTSLSVAVDMRRLEACLTDLVTSADLRRRMGGAGRARVRELFDWRVIFPQYQALWAEQDARRRRGRNEHPALFAGAPAAAPSRPDPFTAFGHYPTAHVGPDTQVRLRPGAAPSRYGELTSLIVLSFFRIAPEIAQKVMQAVAAGPRSVEQIAAGTNLGLASACEVVARLAKIDLVELAGDGGGVSAPASPQGREAG
jgi:glycosyltransferase involved in cell wall biosynthesis